MDADVLIAGAGPVGAALAALLAGQGVSTIVADRETEIYRLPRAAHMRRVGIIAERLQCKIGLYAAGDVERAVVE